MDCYLRPDKSFYYGEQASSDDIYVASPTVSNPQWSSDGWIEGPSIASQLVTPIQIRRTLLGLIANNLTDAEVDNIFHLAQSTGN